MRDTVDLAMIVAIYLTVLGATWGALVDPLRSATYWTSTLMMVLTGFLIAGLAPDAALSVPLLPLAFSTTAWYRERRWRARLIRQEPEPRTPPPPPPSASATG